MHSLDWSALWLIAFLPFLAVYFLPTIVAFVRGHQNRVAICVINLFLGFTFVGWIVCMIWHLRMSSVQRLNAPSRKKNNVLSRGSEARRYYG